MNKTTKTSPSIPHALDYQPAAPALVSRWTWFRRIVALVTAFGVIAAACRVTERRHNLHFGLTGTALTPEESPSMLPVMPANITAFYRNEISPLLDAALRRNRQAADRAIESMHDRFNAHRAGVKPFANEVSGWVTRFGIMGRFAGDSWDHFRGNPNTNAVGDYIQDKFRSHILSEQSLRADVDEVLKQYREDLEASRNQLFAEIKLPLHGNQSPIVLDDKGWDRLCLDVDQRTRRLNATTPRDSVVTGLASVAGGWIGTETAEVIVVAILTRVGGAMAGGSATGGGVGSFGGPAGTAIGIGVGLVVGAVIDWWTSDRLEAHVAHECDTFIDTVERQIVEGSGESPGLRTSFELAAKLADAHQRQAIIDAILEARK
ncbi:MAG TPA: hypothetical protein VFC46_05380 [Humisphaera sp.]|nr:hypothetical protein [Humisphaera sp.]